MKKYYKNYDNLRSELKKLPEHKLVKLQKEILDDLDDIKKMSKKLYFYLEIIDDILNTKH